MKATFFFLLLTLFACNETSTIVSTDDKNENILLEENKLDTILGDKIIDLETNEVRENNFESLKNIPVSELQKESNLYKITPIGEEIFLLRQKKSYTSARLFTVLLTVKNDAIIDYFILNDFKIKDVHRDSDSFLILSDDFENENIYWKRKLQLKIIKLDVNFNKMWEYNASYKNPIEGVKIRSSKSFDTYTINVITGCHICYSIVELQLSKTGNFISVKEVRLHNSQSLPQEQLAPIFNK